MSLRRSVSQEEADTICRDLGGHLVEVNDEAEQRALAEHYRTEAGTRGGQLAQHLGDSGGSFVASFITRLAAATRSHTAWWTGGRYTGAGDTWAWSQHRSDSIINSAVVTILHTFLHCREMNFTNWHPNNLHNPDTESCLALENSDSLSWLSLPCPGREDGSLKLQPLCEKRLV